MNRQDRIESIGARTAPTFTVTGDAWTKLPLSGNRNGVRICNNDASTLVAVTYVENGVAPLIANVPVATAAEDYIGAKQTLTVMVHSGVDIYVANTTGAATTSSVTARVVA